MARKRTKAEKIAARLRRQLASERPRNTEINPVISVRNTVSTVPKTHIPEVTLSTGLLARDLTKSLAVTILALVIQLSLAVYLNRGGWQQVNSMLQNISINH